MKLFSRNYFYLVAGLKEYTPDSSEKGFDARTTRDEIAVELSRGDRAFLTQLYAFYDVENCIAALQGKAAYNPLGNLTREEIDAGLDSPAKLPTWIGKIVTGYRQAADPDIPRDELTIDPDQSIELALWQAYYMRCARSSCGFIRRWSEFDRTIRNIGAAVLARRTGRAINSVVVGTGEIVEALTRSQAVDFGLKTQVDYLEKYLSILESDNILEKERRLDQLRWEMADQLTSDHYFDIDYLLAYLVQLNIVQRWMALDAVQGRRMFEQLSIKLRSPELVDRLTDEVTKKD